MVQVPPDCPICCEPLTADLVAPSKCGHIYHQKCLKRWLASPSGIPGRRCPMCRTSCRASEVVGLQFELTQPSANPDPDGTENESPSVLQTRLSMAKENLNALMRADAERTREFIELKDRVESLQREVGSHLLRASQAEARVSDFRSRLIRAHACRERLTTELQQMKKELVLQNTRRHYLAEAATMSEARALEFLQEKSGEDISSALRLQHSVICELQSENARLKSEKMEQIRHFKAAIQQKDSLIRRKAAATASGREAPVTRRPRPSAAAPITSSPRPGAPPAALPTRNDTNSSSSRELRVAVTGGVAVGRRRRDTDTSTASHKTSVTRSTHPASLGSSEPKVRASVSIHSSSRGQARLPAASAGSGAVSSSVARPKAASRPSVCPKATAISVSSHRASPRLPRVVEAKSRRGTPLAGQGGDGQGSHTNSLKRANTLPASQKIRECTTKTVPKDIVVKGQICVSPLGGVGVGLGSVLVVLFLLAALSWGVGLHDKLLDASV